MKYPDKELSTILYVIHPTIHKDYDLLAIGAIEDLKKLRKKYVYSHLMKNSYAGVPLLIIDTCDTLTAAKNCIKQYKSDNVH